MRCDRDGGGISAGDFLRERWAAEGPIRTSGIPMLRLGAH